MLLTQGKTNWKYILIVVILAVLVGGGILGWIKTKEVVPTEFPEIKKPEKVVEEVKEITKEEIARRKEECAQSEDPALCYISLAKELKSSHICREIDLPHFKNSCYIKVAFYLKDPSVCDNLIEIDLKELEKYWPEAYYFRKRAEYLNSKEACMRISQEAKPWKVYQDKEYVWEIRYPNNFIIEKREGALVFTSPENIITLTSPEIDLWGGKYYWDFLTMKTIRTTKTLEEWLKDRFRLEEFKEFKVAPEEIGWSGVYSIEKFIIREDLQGYKLRESVQAFSLTWRYIDHRDTIIEFDTTGSENNPLLNQILSTFRFLE